MIERLSTGVHGLDEKMKGGFFKNSVNLVTGRTGTGKSSFCASFLYAGAIKGEPGVYVTTEERSENVKNDIKSMFNWDIDKLENKNLLSFLYLEPLVPTEMKVVEDIGRILKIYIYDVSDKIEKIIKKTKAKRLVIDSTTIIEMFIKDEYMRRVGIMKLVNKLRELDVTTILAGNIQEESNALSMGGVIEFFVDTIIKLEFLPVAEEFKRTLTIRKMRRTDHSILIHPFDVTKSGLKIIKI
jgi:circadian clock protein KaiC